MTVVDPTADPTALNPGDPIRVTITDARFLAVVQGNVVQYTTLAGGREFVHELHVGKGWPGHIIERVEEQA